MGGKGTVVRVALAEHNMQFLNIDYIIGIDSALSQSWSSYHLVHYSTDDEALVGLLGQLSSKRDTAYAYCM